MRTLVLLLPAIACLAGCMTISRAEPYQPYRKAEAMNATKAKEELKKTLAGARSGCWHSMMGESAPLVDKVAVDDKGFAFDAQDSDGGSVPQYTWKPFRFEYGGLKPAMYECSGGGYGICVDGKFTGGDMQAADPSEGCIWFTDRDEGERCYQAMLTLAPKK